MNMQEKIVAQNVLLCKQKWARLTSGQRNYVNKFVVKEDEVTFNRMFVMKVHKDTPQEKLIFPTKEISLSETTFKELNKLHRIATDK